MFNNNTQYLIIGHVKTDEKAARRQVQILVGKASVELFIQRRTFPLLDL